MKKYLLSLMILSYYFTYGQCYINDLHFNFLGKEYYEVNNEILVNENISNVILNWGLNYKGEQTQDYMEEFEYLGKKLPQRTVRFNYNLHSCFTNKTKSDYAEVTLKLIDNKVYKVYISKRYKLNDISDFNSDAERLEKMIKNTYKVFNGSYSISHKFNITAENPEGEYMKTGERKEYLKYAIGKEVKIWKVNEASLERSGIYSHGHYQMLGYALPEKEKEITIKFVNLNGTPLDNRGY